MEVCTLPGIKKWSFGRIARHRTRLLRYRFSTFLLWLQSVQILPHLFSAAKVAIFYFPQIIPPNYFLIAPQAWLIAVGRGNEERLLYSSNKRSKVRYAAISCNKFCERGVLGMSFAINSNSCAGNETAQLGFFIYLSLGQQFLQNLFLERREPS